MQDNGKTYFEKAYVTCLGNRHGVEDAPSDWLPDTWAWLVDQNYEAIFDTHESYRDLMAFVVRECDTLDMESTIGELLGEMLEGRFAEDCES